MARYLVVANYTPEGVRGVMESGGSARRDAVSKAISDLGGHLESFDFAFGANDVYVIADLPDNVSAAAMALTVSASGLATTSVTVLLTPEEIDRATKQKVLYAPPGK
jgi:uncharacterized protein with GYD domain